MSSLGMKVGQDGIAQRVEMEVFNQALPAPDGRSAERKNWGLLGMSPSRGVRTLDIPLAGDVQLLSAVLVRAVRGAEPISLLAWRERWLEMWWKEELAALMLCFLPLT